MLRQNVPTLDCQAGTEFIVSYRCEFVHVAGFAYTIGTLPFNNFKYRKVLRIKNKKQEKRDHKLNLIIKIINIIQSK